NPGGWIESRIPIEALSEYDLADLADPSNPPSGATTMRRRDFLAASAAGTALAATVRANVRATKELKVIIPVMKPEELADLKNSAPSVQLVECKSEEEAIRQVAGAHGSYGFLSQSVIRAGKSLKWVQQPSAGVEHLVEMPELLDSDIILTNMQ